MWLLRTAVSASCLFTAQLLVAVHTCTPWGSPGQLCQPGAVGRHETGQGSCQGVSQHKSHTTRGVRIKPSKGATDNKQVDAYSWWGQTEWVLWDQLHSSGTLGALQDTSIHASPYAPWPDKFQQQQ